MAGQINKRGDNSWTARIFLGRDTKGKRKYFNKTVRGTKKDAQKYLTAKLRGKDLGVFVEPASMALETYLESWLQDVAQLRVRERTFESYKGILNLYILPNWVRRSFAILRRLRSREFTGKCNRRDSRRGPFVMRIRFFPPL